MRNWWSWHGPERNGRRGILTGMNDTPRGHYQLCSVTDGWSWTVALHGQSELINNRELGEGLARTKSQARAAAIECLVHTKE